MSEPPSGPKRRRWLDQPHPSRLSDSDPRRAEILDRHQQACRANQSAYLDPATGFTVMTAAYLAERGSCCGQGCRHCPWEGTDSGP